MNDINIFWLKTIDSTNLEAFRNIQNSKDMTVWVAEFQTAGKGQRGSTWESQKTTNLTFSILFKPFNVLASSQFLISQVATLGILNYLKNRGVPAKIKWPNDIYVGDRKICGILIENVISSDKLTASVVGIGLNLNQREFLSDAPNPTSLILEKERLSLVPENDLLIIDEIKILLENILYYYLIISPAEEEFIAQEYHKNLYRLEEKHRFADYDSGEEFNATIKRVDRKTARLELELEDGTTKQFAFKEIKYIF